MNPTHLDDLTGHTQPFQHRFCSVSTKKHKQMHPLFVVMAMIKTNAYNQSNSTPAPVA
jgi:hypothetical protein